MGYESYEGVIETDAWFGPLFTNLRLVKTDVPIHFGTEVPLMQVQPLHRSTYAGAATARLANDRYQRSRSPPGTSTSAATSGARALAGEFLEGGDIGHQKHPPAIAHDEASPRKPEQRARHLLP